MSGNRAKAFTLIELLVVVGIIVALIAILLPSLGRVRERSKLVVCQTHMRAWGQGFAMYATDFDGNLPLDGGDGDSTNPIGRWDDTFLWFNGVVPYVSTTSYDKLQLAARTAGTTPPKGTSNSMFLCPSAGDAAGAPGDLMTKGMFATRGFDNPVGPPSPAYPIRPMLLCYAYNSQLRVWQEMKDFTSNQAGYPGKAQSGDISKLALLTPQTVLIAEKRIRPDELDKKWDPNYAENFDKSLTQNKVAPTRFTARHSKGGSLTFADGHVEWFSNVDVNRGLKANSYNLAGYLVWNPNSPGGGG